MPRALPTSLQTPPERRRRLPVWLAVSVVAHAALWLLTRALPEPERPQKRESIQVAVRERPKPPEPAEPPRNTPPPPPKGPVTPPAEKPQVAAKKKSPELPPKLPAAKEVPPPAPVPPSDVPSQTPPVVVENPRPTAPPGPPAAPPAPDLSRLRLFEPSVIGRSLPRAAPALPRGDRLQMGGDDPESTGAIAARIQSRIADQLQEAIGAANVTAGFVSACDDGIDNNIDGEIDCADPGCRQLALCDHTGIYGEDQPAAIPDGLGTLSRSVDVVQEGRVRKLSLRVDVLHSAPGDLYLALVGPDGRRAVIRLPERGEAAFKKAYYVRPLIGAPANGRWTLEIEDRYEGTRGVLRGWKLYVTS